MELLAPDTSPLVSLRVRRVYRSPFQPHFERGSRSHAWPNSLDVAKQKGMLEDRAITHVADLSR